MVEEKQYHILVVEDEPTNIHVISDCLAKDYKLTIAKTKQKALALLNTKPFEIALLDINLPDGTGYEICQYITSHRETLGEMSIVFMTGMNSVEDEAKGLALGASDYIHKPIHSLILKARIDLQAKLIRKSELLSHLVRLDALTEISNRGGFDEHLGQELARGERENKPISLALLDVDFFKLYNDNYGHPAGDACLKQLASCLRNACRRGTDFVARYGGEEFAVIMYDTDLEAATNLLNNALKAFLKLEIKHDFSSVHDFVTFSCGVCEITPKKPSIGALLKNVDRLLYRAKKQGRAQVTGGKFTDDTPIVLQLEQAEKVNWTI